MDTVHVAVESRPPVTRQEESPQAGREPHPEPLLGCRHSLLPSSGFTQPRLNPLVLVQSLQLILVQQVDQLFLVGTDLHVQLAVPLQKYTPLLRRGRGTGNFILFRLSCLSHTDHGARQL